MNNKTTTAGTHNLLVNQFVECSIENLDFARRERNLFLIEMGKKLNQPGDSKRVRLLNGHRAIIGNTFRLIREACGFDSESMATRCLCSVKDLIAGEECGFLAAMGVGSPIDSYHIGPICAAWLKCRVLYDYFDSDEIPLKDIPDFNDAMISDIENEIRQCFVPSDEDFKVSLEEIKSSYKTINDILESYRIY